MQNAITTLRIQNFKSIKDVTLTPRRVNLIIGEPNVGKSNILEAISLLGGMVYDKTPRFMAGTIRYEQPNQLYYDNVSANTIHVESDKASCVIRSGRFPETSQVLYLPAVSIEKMREFSARHGKAVVNNSILNEAFSDIARGGEPGKWVGDSIPFGFRNIRQDGGMVEGELGFEKSTRGIENSIAVRYYQFRKGVPVGKDFGVKFLFPPNGANLKSIIQSYAVLRQEVANFFKPYGLKMLLRMASNELEIAKEVGELMYTYPYSSIADTLQRLIFYLAAIESNDDAVLLFEEPEAHSFPAYIMHLAQRIVESRGNQFFVVTHNPYLLTEILEEMLTDDELKPELAIFVAYYEEYQTKVYQLTDEEMIAARADGLDFFLNLRRFVPEVE